MRKDEFPIIDKIREEAYQQGKAEGIKNTIGIIQTFVKEWNNQNSKKIPYFAIDELVEYIRQQELKKDTVSRYVGMYIDRSRV